jgi:opacity protein-like surface antigen
MVTIPQLWLPILVAAGVVTLAGGIAWAVLPRPLPARGSASPLLRDLALLAVYAIVINVFVGYVTGRAVPAGADYKEVFRFAATAGVLSYAAGQFLGAIRGTQTWEAAGWNFAYGIIFGLLTGGPFAAFWPDS